MQAVTIEQLEAIQPDQAWETAWITADGDQINVSVERPSGKMFHLSIATPWHSGGGQYATPHAVRGAIMALPD